MRINLRTTAVIGVLFELLIVLGAIQGTPATRANGEEAASAPSIFDRDAKHIWNRLHDAVLIRRDQTGAAYGADALDPLLWRETEHLLTGSSHQRVVNILDEFLRTHGEKEIRDPVKRAWLQRSLWAVFDWSAMPGGKHLSERRELQMRLAEVMRRLALSAGEIKALPDNYAQAVSSGTFAREYDPANPERAFLPPDLFQPRGPWVCIKGNGAPVAETHIGAFSGRSQFFVFVRLPEGRQATLDYLRAVWNVAEPWVEGELDTMRRDLNPRLPQFPVGTQAALVRQMTLFDRGSALATTPITESVQIRVYRAITGRPNGNNVGVDWPAARVEQAFYEMRLSPAQLFAGQAGGLRAVVRDETEFSVFQTQGIDWFEYEAKKRAPVEKDAGGILKRCAGCHSAPGINSVQSRRKLLKPNDAQVDKDPPYDARWWETENALGWKANHYDWGLLNGYWQAGGGR